MQAPPPDRSDAITTWKRWVVGPRSGDRMLLYEELATQVGAGFGLREAIENLRSRASGTRLRALDGLADAVAHDVPPGDAMLRFPEHFAPVEARLVATGERTGRYDLSFRDAAQEVARARATATKIVRAVAYPVFLLHFFLCVPACAVTRALAGGNAAAALVLVGLLAFWGLLLAGTTWHLQRRGSISWGRLVARLPLVGQLSRAASVSRACRVTAALHDAGANLPESLEAAADAAGNGWIAADLRSAASLVTDGRPLTQALSVVAALEPESRSLIDTGERSGEVAEAFGRISTIEEERLDRAARALAGGLPVILMVVVGGLVLVAFALLLYSYFDPILRL